MKKTLFYLLLVFALVTPCYGDQDFTLAVVNQTNEPIVTAYAGGSYCIDIDDSQMKPVTLWPNYKRYYSGTFRNKTGECAWNPSKPASMQFHVWNSNLTGIADINYNDLNYSVRYHLDGYQLKPKGDDTDMTYYVSKVPGK